MDVDSRLVTKYFLLWRLFLFLPLIIAQAIPLRTGYLYSFLDHPMFSPWANFDGVHYISIASSGYGSQAAFFPLFPILIRLLSFWTNNINAYFLSGLLIANCAFWAALVVFYKLVSLDYSKRVAEWSVIFMLVFPTSFFFASVYSESLFLLLLLLSFWFARKKRWFWATIFGVFVSATRFVGIVLAPALYLIHRKWILLLVPLGTIGYSLFNLFRWSEPFYFIKAHGELANGRSTESVILFPQTVYRYFNIIVSLTPTQFEWWVATSELSSFFLVVFLLYKSIKLKINQPYVLFSILAFLVPVSSGTFSGLPRYVLVLFPIYIVFAQIKSVKLRILLVILFGIMLIILLIFFSRGYFIA